MAKPSIKKANQHSIHVELSVDRRNQPIYSPWLSDDSSPEGEYAVECGVFFVH